MRPWEMVAMTTVIRIMVAKSATRAAMRIVCPKRPRMSSCSLSTGMTTPSDVVDMMSAIIQGLLTRPTCRRAKPTMADRERVRMKPMRLMESGPKVRRSRACDGVRSVRVPPARATPGSSMFRLAKSISMPARNMRKTKPNSARSVSSWSSWVTQPKPLLPTTIPARISPTTMGSRRRSKRVSSSGTMKASEMTISRGVNDPAISSIWSSRLSCFRSLL